MNTQSNHPFDQLADAAWTTYETQPDHPQADYLRAATYALEDALDANQPAWQLAKDVAHTISSITGDSPSEVIASLPTVAAHLGGAL